SEDTQHEIDAEVRDLIGRCEKRAIEIITKHKPALERIRAVLMEKEVLEREEFEKLMAASEGAAAAAATAVPEPAASRPSAASASAREVIRESPCNFRPLPTDPTTGT